MNRHVFQYHEETSERNQFVQTSEELESYVGLHINHYPDDMKRMIKEMADIKILPPANHSDQAERTEIRLWEETVEAYFERSAMYNTNICPLYSIIWSQCSDGMQAKLKANKDFEDIKTNTDSLAQLMEIKGIAYTFESQRNMYLVINNAKTELYSQKQFPDKLNS
jgi:hypothetical protein